MDGQSLLIWIIVGAVAGLLGNALVGGLRGGLLAAIVVGILGAFVGSWLFGALNITIGVAGILGDIIVATIGAIVLLVILKMVR